MPRVFHSSSRISGACVFSVLHRSNSLPFTTVFRGAYLFRIEGTASRNEEKKKKQMATEEEETSRSKIPKFLRVEPLTTGTNCAVGTRVE